MSGISPVRVGQTDPPAHLHFVDDLGKPFPFPAGTTFQFYLYSPSTNVTLLGTGTFVNANFALGLVDYQWSPQDTATPGKYHVFAQYTLPTGGVGFGDEQDFVVKPLYMQQ